MLFPPVIRAQLPHRLEHCLPFPTFADEVKDMLRQPSQQPPKIRVASVNFSGEAVRETIRAQMESDLEQTSLDEDLDWLDLLRETAVRTLQRHGYFRPEVRARATVLSRDSAEQRVSLTLEVSPGPQYTLAEIHISQAHEFAADQLRKLFPLQDGDLFNLDKIRAGMEALTRLYGSHGYINFTAEPDLRPDNAHHRILLRLDLEEGEQFRVGSVKVLSLEGQLPAESLTIKLQPGDVFNSQLVEEFYRDNQSVLPADVSPREDTQITQDARAHTVAAVFDVRACP